MSADLLSPRSAKVAPITTADVRAALMRRYAAPEWALLFEVGDATGARHTRFADAVAMSLWPSRGLELWGMEIKVSRADWQRERAAPQKAETIAAYCDRWLLVTGPNVVADPSEVPPAWGWLVVDAGGMRTMREAGRTDATPCDRKFLAALLRRASEVDRRVVDAEVAKRMVDREADFDRRVLAEVTRRSSHREELTRNVAAFEEASGLKISDVSFYSDSAARQGRAVKALIASGVDRAYDELRHTADRLRQSAELIEASIAEIGIPAEEAAPTVARRRGAR